MGNGHVPMQKFAITDDTLVWTGAEGDEAYFSDVVDESHGSRLGVTFIRWGPGQTHEFDFPLPYDELFVVLRGAYSVTSQDGTVTARAGEVLFLPAGSEGRYHSDEGAELVALTSPPYRTALTEAGLGHLLVDQPVEH